MGFSLVGNSGDTSTTTNTYNLSADLNPQLDFQGSGSGALGINISPLSQFGSIGNISPEIYDYYAPVNITSVGAAQGDAALAALAGIADAQVAAGAPNSSTAATPSTLSSLLSGDNLYYVLGGLVLLFLTFKK